MCIWTVKGSELFYEEEVILIRRSYFYWKCIAHYFSCSLRNRKTPWLVWIPSYKRITIFRGSLRLSSWARFSRSRPASLLWFQQPLINQSWPRFLWRHNRSRWQVAALTRRLVSRGGCSPLAVPLSPPLQQDLYRLLRYIVQRCEYCVHACLGTGKHRFLDVLSLKLHQHWAKIPFILFLL